MRIAGSFTTGLAAVGVIILLGAPAAGQGNNWKQSGEGAEVPGAPGVLDTRWVSTRPPGGPHDRIQLHRYSSREASGAVLLYLPGPWTARPSVRSHVWSVQTSGPSIWPLSRLGVARPGMYIFITTRMTIGMASRNGSGPVIRQKLLPLPPTRSTWPGAVLTGL